MGQAGLQGIPISLEEVLQSREERAARQRALLGAFRSAVVSFTINMPGPVKRNPIALEAHRRGVKLFQGALQRAGCSVLSEEMLDQPTGPEAYWSVDAEPLRVKAIASSVEESLPLGRLFDLDVIGPDGTPISRTRIGLSRRSCLLCGADSAVCARSRTHSVAELLERIAELAGEAGLSCEEGAVEEQTGCGGKR